MGETLSTNEKVKIHKKIFRNTLSGESTIDLGETGRTELTYLLYILI
jgi:hypothetical protein